MVHVRLRIAPWPRAEPITCDDIDGRIADDQALARAIRERTRSNTPGEVRSLHGEVLKRF